MHDTPLDYLPKKGAAGAIGDFAADLVAGERGVGAAAKRKRADAVGGGATRLARRGGGAGTQGSAAGGGSLVRKTRRRSKNGQRMPMHFGLRVEYDAPTVPTAPPPEVAATIDTEDDLYAALKAKFAQRPIWSRQALVSSLPPHIYHTHERLRRRLPQLAYYFSQGPWRMCWISFGYDPRSSRDARVYQVLDMRLPAGAEHLVPKKSIKRKMGAPTRIEEASASTSAGGGGGLPGGATSGSGGGGGGAGSSSTAIVVSNGTAAREHDDDLSTADRAPVPGDRPRRRSGTSHFQMCDFTGDEVVQLVHEEEEGFAEAGGGADGGKGGGGAAGPRCHKAHGWYSADVMERIRTLVKQACSARKRCGCRRQWRRWRWRRRHWRWRRWRRRWWRRRSWWPHSFWPRSAPASAEVRGAGGGKRRGGC